MGGAVLPSQAGRAALVLRDPSGRVLTLVREDDGSVRAVITFSALIHWSVTVPAADVERLKEWLG